MPAALAPRPDLGADVLDSFEALALEALGQAQVELLVVDADEDVGARGAETINEG